MLKILERSILRAFGVEIRLEISILSSICKNYIMFQELRKKEDLAVLRNTMIVVLALNTMLTDY